MHEAMRLFTGPDDDPPLPELTPALIARLFDAHGLGPVRHVAPMRGGQINQTLLVNGDLVLRVRPLGKKDGAFLTERRLYERLRGRAPVPEVLALDTSREVAPFDWVVQRRLPGESLARLWLGAGERQRGWLLSQVAETMRALHDERFPACGGFRAGELQPAFSWAAYLDERFERRLQRLHTFPNADRVLLGAIDAFRRRHRGALDDGPIGLVHRDLHFGNLLAEGHRLTGLLDFEAAVAAPPDYELDQVARFLRFPVLFVEEEPRPAPAHYGGVWDALRRAYPGPFHVRDLTVRLSLYSLEYDLAALRDCYAGRWDATAHRHVLDRIHAALDERVMP
jgi:aminoglycoside phosphotransferase (APT) family kinase protein